MSGECDKCGEHALECACPKHIAGPNDKFYYQGKFFEKEDDFWSYIKEFTLRQTTVDDFNGLFDMLKKDIWMNISIRKTPITNSELRTILYEAFTFILKKCWKEDI
jgi:RNAse (barnase) inhibitor barstar